MFVILHQRFNRRYNFCYVLASFTLCFLFPSAVPQAGPKFVNNIQGAGNVMIGDHIKATIGVSSTDGNYYKKCQELHEVIVYSAT